MRAVNRTFIGGAFGALTAATIAASTAFACHPSQQLLLSAETGQPGTAVRVEAYGFQPGHAMEVRWGTRETADLVLATVVVEQPSGTGAAQASVMVTIPASAMVDTQYAIVGYQAPAEVDGAVKRAVKMFTVVGAPAPAPAPEQAQPNSPLEPALPTETREEAPQQAPAPQVVAPAPAVQRAPAGAPVVNRPARTVNTPLATQEAPARGSAPAVIAAPGGAVASDPAATTSPAAGVAPLSAQPAADDLWSGLQADATPTLLDAPVTAGDESSASFGVLLLGFGLVALAGVGAVAGRRRLALAGRR